MGERVRQAHAETAKKCVTLCGQPSSTPKNYWIEGPCFVAEDFLSVDDDALVAEPLTDQEIIESVAAPAASEPDEDEADNAEVTELPPPTINDALGALSTLRRFIET